MEKLKFEDLLAKPKKFVVAGKEVEIPPLSVEDIDIFIKAQTGSEEERFNALKEIFIRTMMKIFPEETEEDIRRIPALTAIEFFPKILVANGLIESERELEKLIEDFRKSLTKSK